MIRTTESAERRILRVRTTESRTFSEAYLVLRRRARRAPIRDIVAEAERIVRSCERRDRVRSERRRRQLAAFLVGLLAGVAATASLVVIAMLCVLN